jgi:hypothetical protein
LFTEEKTHAAETLDDYRGNWKYNLLDKNLLAFNAEVPTVSQWDDHEVLNNWWPGERLTRGEHHLQPRPLALPGLALAKGTAGRDDFIVFFRRLKWEQNLTCATLAL